MVELKKANIADYINFVMSTLVLLFCLIVTVYAIVLKVRYLLVFHAQLLSQLCKIMIVFCLMIQKKIIASLSKFKELELLGKLYVKNVFLLSTHGKVADKSHLKYNMLHKYIS